jgi:hypothetical protein
MYKTVRGAANIKYSWMPYAYPPVVYVKSKSHSLNIKYFNSSSHHVKHKVSTSGIHLFVNSPFHSFIHKVSISSLC